MLTKEIMHRMDAGDVAAYIDELQNIAHAQSRYIRDQRILIESLTDITAQLRSLVDTASRCAEVGRMLTERESEYTQKYGKPITDNYTADKGER